MHRNTRGQQLFVLLVLQKKRKENYSLAPDSNPSLLFHLMRQKVFTGKCCFPSNNVFDSAAPLCMICLTFNVCDSVPLTK